MQRLERGKILAYESSLANVARVRWSSGLVGYSQEFQFYLRAFGDQELICLMLYGEQMEGDKLFYAVQTKLTVLTWENGSGDTKRKSKDIQDTCCRFKAIRIMMD